ncbi:hybrid sensor histidine kinase/response regulator [Oscillatoria acuminata]|uniref:Circadian input-output histidine kinase CikA n=1 Tax=Oscillatoria acuminata PCC 6304 TaxID=56110 RepID=K9TRV6_9CYAN|nr:ATP-binding protein [Oscillatoria acuminata]AFY84739.1 PAS domain S-box [Oscillatoria acuminata PCC 6304]
MEEELHRQEQLFKSLADHAPDGIARFDRHLRHVYLNQAVEKGLGIPAEAILGKTHQELEIPEAIASLYQQQLSQTFATGCECLFEYQFQGSDGMRFFQTKVFPELTAEGSVEFVLSISRDITEYKRVEQAFQKTESRFRRIFESNMIGMGFWDVTGQITAANDAMLKMLGYTREEFESQGLSWESITPQKYHQADLEAREEALAQGYCTPYEKEFICKDGSRVPCISGGATFEDTTEEGVFFALDQRDRKRTENAQQYLSEASTILSSSLDYQITLANVADLTVPHLADWCTVSVVEENGRLQPPITAHINPEKVAWAKELHYKYPVDPDAPRGSPQVLRTGVSEFYPYIPEQLLVEAAQDEEHLQILKEVGFSSVMIVPMIARGRTLGTISFVAAESGRRYDRSDLNMAEELARRAALAVDNARLYEQAQQARRMAEEAAARTARLQAVTAALSEALTPAEVAEVVVNQGIAALDAKAGSLVILTDNNQSLKIVGAIGYPQEIIDQWLNIPVNAPVPLAECVRIGEPIFIENLGDLSVRYPRVSQLPKITKHQALAAIPLILQGQPIGAMGLSFVETREFSPEDRAFMVALSQQCAQAIARSQLYQAEQSARAQAETANRVRDEFIAVLSHELRSPLNPILGWTKLLQMRKFDEAKTLQALDIIERNALLQSRLIEDLLDISRILLGKLTLEMLPVHLGKIIESALETVRLAAEAKKIRIEKFLPMEAVEVLGDPNRLQQVVWNLLSNAVKFTPEGGEVTICLESTGNLAQIEVSDTGRGIAPEFLPYVFEYFRQADSKTTRSVGGLGLGLAIVHNLVELHGGSVQAESDGEEQGARFAVTLPLIAVGSLVAEESVLPESELSLAGIALVVVDDDPDTLEFLEFVLQEYGAKVRAVSSAQQAIAAIETSIPDLLLSDIGMPQMDGYMLIRELRQWEAQRGGSIPAIALTAYAGETNRQQILEAGFQQHLAKPIQPAELVQAIAFWVNHHQHSN